MVQLLMNRRFGQLIRFGITGIANTAVYYLSYRLLLVFSHYFIAHLTAWSISVVFSFFVNSYFTYRTKPTLSKFFAFPITSIFNLLFTSVGSVLFIELFSFDEKYTPLLLGILAIPITFMMTTFILDSDKDIKTRLKSKFYISEYAKKTFLEALGAFGFVVLGYSTAAKFAGFYPFGSKSQQFGDLSGQFVPLAGMARDIFTADSGLSSVTWTWAVGMGSPNIGNYATYFSNPLWMLLVIFPKDQIQFGVWILTVVMMGLAASAMAILLRNLIPHTHSLWLILLSGSYGLSSWAVQDADYILMWLSGLIGLPLIVLAGLWSAQKKRFILSVLIIALIWYSNYYSAFMASVGAAIIVFSILLASAYSNKFILKGMFEFFIRGLIGVSLTAIILLPAYLEVKQSPIDLDGGVPVDYPIRRTLAHIFPGIEAVSLSPSFYIGSFALILALLFLFEAKHNLKKRIVWLGTLSLTIISMGTQPFLHLWNLGDVPNGSPWRSAFVVTAILVIMACYGLEHFKSLSIISFVNVSLILSVLMLLTIWSLYVEDSIRSFTSIGLISTAIVISLLLMLSCFKPKTNIQASLSIIIFIVMFSELVFNTAFIEDNFSKVVHAFEIRSPNISQQVDLDDIGWPTHRAKIHEFSSVKSSNAGALMSAPTVDYYSSTINELTSRTLLDELRLGSGHRPRIIYPTTSDPVADKISSVSRIYTPNGIETATSFPLVRSIENINVIDDRLSPLFIRRNEVIGESVYHMPNNIEIIPAGGDEILLSISCEAGHHISLDMSGYAAKIFFSEAEYVAGYEVWTAPESSGHDPKVLRIQPIKGTPEIEHLIPLIACVNLNSLDEIIEAVDVPVITASPGRISADFNKPINRALISTAYLEAWDCKSPLGQVSTGSLHGLLVVELNSESQFSCNYVNPGFKLGALITLLSCVTAILIVVCRKYLYKTS